MINSFSPKQVDCSRKSSRPYLSHTVTFESPNPHTTPYTTTDKNYELWIIFALHASLCTTIFQPMLLFFLFYFYCDGAWTLCVSEIKFELNSMCEKCTATFDAGFILGSKFNLGIFFSNYFILLSYYSFYLYSARHSSGRCFTPKDSKDLIKNLESCMP